MKYYAFVLFPFLLCSCAGTYADSQRVYTQANVERLEWHGRGGASLVLVKADHSTPTRAGGSFIGTAATGVAGVATAIATHGLYR